MFILGKVRIGKVKSVSNELVSKFPTVFSTEFEVNKKLVYQYSDIRSKHLNNRVAGYITRLLVSQKKREEALKLEEAEAQAPAVEMATEETAEEAQPEAAVAPPGAGEGEKGGGAEASTEAEDEAGGEEGSEGQDAAQGKAE